MHGIALTGIAIVVGLSFVVDGSGTTKAIITIVKIGGMTYIVKNIMNKVDTDKANLIGMAGWCMASGAMVTVLKNSLQMVTPVVSVVGKIGSAIGAVGGFLDKLVELADYATFWN